MIEKRTYQETHPWITFSHKLDKIDYALWILLGAAASKAEHISGVPLLPQVAEDMHTLYLAKGALATTAIEGNTLTESDAIAQVSGKLVVSPSRQYQQTELNNILVACKSLTEKLFSDGNSKITIDLLCWMNSMVLKDLELSGEVSPGFFRQHKVQVGNYSCAPWQDCGYLMDRFCDFLNDFEIPQENKLVFALIKAIFAHIYFVWIHPFADGNGRTARMMEFFILMSAGFPTPTCHLLSNHYNMTRSEYYRQLERSSKIEDGVFSFIKYAVRGMVDGLVEQISYIREQHIFVSWTNYVHEVFRGISSEAERRRRDVILALAFRENIFIKKSEIPKLNTDIAVKYAGKTGKTLARDLKELIRLGLLEESKDGVRDRREIIIRFLPARLSDDKSGELNL